MSSFQLDEGAIEQLMNTEVQSAVDEIARKRTEDMDNLRSRCDGRPAADIKPELQQLFVRDGGSITDPELSEYAEAISNGTRIKFKADKIR